MPLLFRFLWTRLSHGSAVIRSSPGNLIPREVGRMSEYFRNANNRSSRLQYFLHIWTFLNVHSPRGLLYLRVERVAVRRRLSDLKPSPCNIQPQHVVFPRGRAAPAIFAFAPLCHQFLLHLAQGVSERIRLQLNDELAVFVSVLGRGCIDPTAFP